MDHLDRSHAIKRSDRRPDRPASVPKRALTPALILAAAVAILLAVGSATALAATTVTLDPSTATPGTRVVIQNACYLVTDHPPAKLNMVFLDATRTDLQPTDRSLPKATARVVTAPYTYEFTVPRIPTGDYTIALKCLPSDWSTNGAEGASLPLTVIAGPPSTSTVSIETSKDGSGFNGAVVLTLGIGLLGGMATWRRAPPRT